MKGIFWAGFNAIFCFIIPFIPLYIGGWNFERNIEAQHTSVIGLMFAAGAVGVTLILKNPPKIFDDVD